MESRRAPEYILEVFADPDSVKDIVKGALEHDLDCYFIAVGRLDQILK